MYYKNEGNARKNIQFVQDLSCEDKQKNIDSQLNIAR